MTPAILVVLVGLLLLLWDIADSLQRILDILQRGDPPAKPEMVN